MRSSLADTSILSIKGAGSRRMRIESDCGKTRSFAVMKPGEETNNEPSWLGLSRVNSP
jgi:hypothetical protein